MPNCVFGGEKTKCDAVRTFLNGASYNCCTKCGPCASNPGSNSCPANCYQYNPADFCATGQLATRYDMAFNHKYLPKGFASADARATRLKQMQIDNTAIDDFKQELEQSFGSKAGGVPEDQLGISWFDMTKCMGNSNGKPWGADRTKYPTRKDLYAVGYSSNPLIGSATTLQGKTPAWAPPLVPIWMDRIMSPDLAVLVIFVLLVIIFGVLIYSAYRWKAGKTTRAAVAKEKEKEAQEGLDPFRGQGAESYYTRQAKIRNFVESREKLGFDMSQYRISYNLPPKGQ